MVTNIYYIEVEEPFIEFSYLKAYNNSAYYVDNLVEMDHLHDTLYLLLLF